MTLCEFYAAVGGSYTDAMGRLQSEAFLTKFLRMLPQDGSMALLADALARGSAGDAFRAVHTLKGIALNLSLTSLASACSDMTEALRGRDAMPGDTPALYDAVVQAYGVVTETLKQLEA